MLTQETILETLKGFEQEAIDAASKIATDPRLDQRYRDQETAKLFTAGQDRVKTWVDSELYTLESERGKLTKAARVNFAPAPEQAPLLAYVKDALLARWDSGKYADLLDGWRAALDGGDLITARVYADFAPRWVQQNVDGDRIATPDIEPLAQETRRALMTPEQRAAADRLAQLDDLIMGLNMAAREAEARLEGASINATGDLIDGITRRAFENVKRMF